MCSVLQFPLIIVLKPNKFLRKYILIEDACVENCIYTCHLKNNIAHGLVWKLLVSCVMTATITSLLEYFFLLLFFWKVRCLSSVWYWATFSITRQERHWILTLTMRPLQFLIYFSYHCSFSISNTYVIMTLW